jgi:hypothetical protein
MQNAQYFSQTLIEFGVSQQIFTDVPNIKFHGHQPSRGEADISRERAECDKATWRFS